MTSLARTVSLAFSFTSVFTTMAFSAPLLSEREITARSLIQGSSQPTPAHPLGGDWSTTDLARVEAELNALGLRFPKETQINQHGATRWNFNFLSLYFPQNPQGEVFSTLKNLLAIEESQVEYSPKYDLLSLFKGGAFSTPALDALDKSYGIVGLKAYFQGGTLRGPNGEAFISAPLELSFIAVELASSFDAAKIASELNQRFGSEILATNEGMTIGDGDRIYRMVKPSGEALYVFRHGGGDCPAGCFANSYYFFSVTPEAGADLNQSDSYTIQQFLKGSNDKSPMWGYPRRFNLRAFADYNELLATLASADWWKRMHAVFASK